MKRKKYSKIDIYKIIIMVYVDAIDNIFFERSDDWAKQTAKEDILWILEDDTEHPLSYLNVCEALRINNPQKLRKIIYFYHHNKDKKDFTEFRKMLDKVLKRIRKNLSYWED